jgi:hypothetical protein
MAIRCLNRAVYRWGCGWRRVPVPITPVINRDGGWNVRSIVLMSKMTDEARWGRKHFRFFDQDKKRPMLCRNVAASGGAHQAHGKCACMLVSIDRDVHGRNRDLCLDDAVVVSARDFGLISLGSDCSCLVLVRCDVHETCTTFGMICMSECQMFFCYEWNETKPHVRRSWQETISISIVLYIYIYIYMCVCVCVSYSRSNYN